jgi:hypothetical protein
MTDRQSLRAMIESASEKIETIFRRTGEILPIWHWFDRDGNEHVSAAPPGGKDTSVAIMRALFELQGATRCLFIDEAWTWDGHYKGPEASERIMKWIKEHGGLANHPDRIECVTFVGEDEHGSMQAHRRIIRGHGKPKLGPLEFLNMAGVISSGRMIGLLPRQAGQTIQ